MTTSSIEKRFLAGIPLDRRSCQLLGPTALVVQALMGVLAVSSLVYKRQRETQKRPWHIWLFDVSKQVVGAMFIHGLNVLVSNLGSYQYSGNACTYYFLNILVDTTLGVGLIYVALQCLTWLLSKKFGIKGLKSGQYGNPPSLTYWVRQATIYLLALTVMKLLVVALFAFWPGISTSGDWLLAWTTFFDGESVQVIFVMGVFPMIMNVVQFWLIDSIVKANPLAARGILSRNSDAQDREPLFNSSEDHDDNSPQDVEIGPESSTPRLTPEGDSKTLVSTEDHKTKLLSPGPGSSTPMSLSRMTAAVAHDYPPNSASSHGSTRPRHKYKRASSLALDSPITRSASTADTLDASRKAPRQLLSDVIEIGDLEKDDWEQRVDGGWSSRRSERNMVSINISAR